VEYHKLNKLIELRKQKGYSMKDMAEMLDICTSYYCQLELGHRNLYYKLAIKIADIFKLKPDEMFYEDITK